MKNKIKQYKLIFIILGIFSTGILYYVILDDFDYYNHTVKIIYIDNTEEIVTICDNYLRENISVRRQAVPTYYNYINVKKVFLLNKEFNYTNYKECLLWSIVVCFFSYFFIYISLKLLYEKF